MTIFTGIVLYLMIYWLVIFAVLPFGVKRDDDPQLGNSTGAPVYVNMKRKFIITGFVAAVVWLFVFGLIKADVIDFYDIAAKMSAEDEAKP